MGRTHEFPDPPRVSETRRWLSAEEHVVRDIMCCAISNGAIGGLPTEFKLGAGIENNLNIENKNE